MSLNGYSIEWDGPDPNNKQEDTYFSVLVIASNILDAIRLFRGAYPEHTVENIQNISILNYSKVIC